MEMILMVGALAIGIAGFLQWQDHTQRSALARLGERLGGAVDTVQRSASGRLRGVAMTIRFGSGTAGAMGRSWTEIEGALPPDCPLLLDVHPRGVFDGRLIGRGEMVDIELGDEEFDRKFLVEGAPADVVSRLLTPALRKFLLDHEGTLQTTLGRDGAPIVRLSVAGWLEDASASDPALMLVAEFCTALATAHAAADHTVRTTSVAEATPYRHVDPVDVAREARSAEVRHLDAARRGRSLRREYVALAVLALVLLALVVYSWSRPA